MRNVDAGEILAARQVGYSAAASDATIASRVDSFLIMGVFLQG